MKDKVLEKKHERLVRSGVAHTLKVYGFRRTKPAYYTRLLNDRIEFVYLDKLRSSSYFRIYTGIRFLLDTREAVVLNGQVANGGLGEYEYRYNFRFHNKPDTVDRCIGQITLFSEQEGLPWFEYWRDREQLLSAEGSPLEHELRESYLRSESDPSPEFMEWARKSKDMLGIKEENRE